MGGRESCFFYLWLTLSSLPFLASFNKTIPPLKMLIGVMGKMGSGKSLAVAFLANCFSRVLKQPIYTNDPSYKYGHHLESRAELQSVKNGILVLDEAHGLVDARNFKDTKQMKLTHWVMTLRKKNLVAFIVSQHIRQVDIRLRWVMDILMLCEEVRPKPAQRFKLSFCDFWYGTIGRTLYLDRPERFYNLYDTYAEITPLE